MMTADAHPVTQDELRFELSRTQDELRVELNRLRHEIVTHYATKADLHAVETRLVKWMIGLMLSSMGAAVAIAVAVDRLWA